MRWSNIRSLAHVKYFNVCYIALVAIPVLAEIYLHFQKPGHHSVFPWQLTCLYLSSICYALGLALYQFACPQIITQYERDTDYLQAEKEVHMNARPDRKVEIVLSNLLDAQMNIRDRLVSLRMLREPNSTQTAELDSIIEEYYPSCVQRYLLAEYARKDLRLPCLIWICAILYLVGTAIMLFLVTWKTIKVFQA
jgi:hypothetical protein